jgi:hypothetical protein
MKQSKKTKSKFLKYRVGKSEPLSLKYSLNVGKPLFPIVIVADEHHTLSTKKVGDMVHAKLEDSRKVVPTSCRQVVKFKEVGNVVHATIDDIPEVVATTCREVDKSKVEKVVRAEVEDVDP